jgi:hypothetical protein
VAGFIEGGCRRERLLLPDCLDDYVDEENLVRVVDVFVDKLDLPTLGFAGPAATGRPGYSPATMLKLYLDGHLNQVQSSRRLEREAGATSNASAARSASSLARRWRWMAPLQGGEHPRRSAISF